MRETLIVVGLIVLGFALRSARRGALRKAGALTFVVAGYFAFAFLSGCWWCGVLLGILPWFCLPWIELLTRIRRMRLPIENRLHHSRPPNPGFFPKAPEAAAAMEDEGFEHVDDCGWEWSGMRQFFQLYWHPVARAEAAICLCEQENVAFAFVTVTSRDPQGRIWRTTNFPFSPTLKSPPDVHWHHVPCEKACFHQILEDHRAFLKRMKIDVETLRVPDPDEMEESIEAEMDRQIRHNLEAGIIRPCGEHHFEYSTRGLFFLWGQYVKDMVRLC